MKKTVFLSVLILALITLPYVAAWLFQGERIFSGLLFNPTDGYSYLAKMREGWQGSWRFFLPYSAPGGDGAYIFLFYLFLGHTARWLNAPTALIFHMARLIGSIILIWSLDGFLRKIMRLEPEQTAKTLVLICLGAGLGWMGLLAGSTLPDFWLAEAFPFLSMFANPHFPFGLGLMVFFFTSAGSLHGWKATLFVSTIGFALSVVMPFGYVIVAAVCVVMTVWEFIEKRKSEYAKNIFSLIPGGLWLVYQYAAVLNDSVLRFWNMQNVTPSPAFIDIVLAFSPAILAGIWGSVTVVRNKKIPGGRLTVVWFVVSLLFAVLPFGIQRRFLTGIYIPITVLGMQALESLPWDRQALKKGLYLAWLLLSLPSNFLTLGVFTSAGLSHDNRVFLKPGESEAFAWMTKNIPPGSLCIAGAETGMLLPAYSPCFVIYGHPFESIHAGKSKIRIDRFYDPSSDEDKNQSYLIEQGVDYIVVNKARGDGNPELPEGATLNLFINNDVEILEVAP